MRRRLIPAEPWAPTAVDDRRTRVYYWWLLLALIFEYVRPAFFLPPIDVLKLNSLIPLSLLAMVLFAPGLRPFSTIFADRYARWMVAYLALILITVPFAPVHFYAYDVFKRALANAFLCLIIARVVTSEERLRGVFATLILAHLFLLVMNPDLILKPDVRSYVEGAPFLGTATTLRFRSASCFP